MSLRHRADDGVRTPVLLLVLILASLLSMSLLQETLTAEVPPPPTRPPMVRHALLQLEPTAVPVPSVTATWAPRTNATPTNATPTATPQTPFPTDKWGNIFPKDPAGKIECAVIAMGHLSVEYVNTTDCYSVEDRRAMLRTMVYTLIDGLEANGIEYWLDSGSLLGSVRDGGLIPFDLDADFGLTHASFTKLRHTSIAFPSRYELFVNKSPLYKKGPYAYLPGRFVDKHKGFYVDLFEFHPSINTTQVNTTSILHVAGGKHATLRTHDAIVSVESITANTSTHLTVTTTTTVEIDVLAPVASVCWWACKHCPAPNHFVVPRDWVFPLVRCKFDDRRAWCPANTHAYLTMLYGDTYMTPQ
ncbi:hypothetical protein SPRG_07870 [Saprolegnia parasitica CBS 223.65]|uniref:LicD/FKTN/FKRP nucleotidyltransferase domain-containing protein n=1 Tax=Saprolegnia parasitica (strain CBS 223.65) TaxID=695850 RepID=A0A067C9J7_SAPPC|nr:hypothetical protein SPRG_07870 [Saprolegnia parasitica CBS 223.65]KDO27163.1 hypothetical protein SPRG_07870 [Saprolegnia parasitica CBS 223.65]|eukprot:XP_012202251.1 hypothetical protein SPRG_07870 [Saprolegnia parasitica CBS 223.65]